MGDGIKICILFIVLIALYTTGTLIFTKGFLLKRFVVNENSSCNADFAAQSDAHGDDGCWQHSRFKRAIIVVIDALKYEFMTYDHKLQSDVPYLNKLPFLDNILRSKPRNSRLYQFIADPPTTTLQRLKGLTTGSLPTFVDAGANFASTEILEDNVIDQLIRQDKRIKFLGDDTWMGLFPNRFSKAFPFPSFNVKDLNTVDNSILKHLLPEVRKKNWDVIIAHFIGVDHCGHRFGPNHPAMSEKLAQMDGMLRNLTREMKDDTVLFVMGDHGMTRTGDHGGDSRDEVEAGLFVYSPGQLTSTDYNPNTVSAVAQTDFVPTLSLLLGVPIPFSNLGQVILDLFTYCPWWKSGSSEVKQTYHAVKTLRLNAHQIATYLRAYSSVSSDFPEDRLHQLYDLLDHAELDLQRLLTSMVQEGETPDILNRFRVLQEHYTQFVTEVREICQGVWAKFDVVSILIGILTMSIALAVNVVVLQCLSRDGEASWFPVTVAITSASAYLVYAIVQTVYLSEFVNPMMLFIFGAVLLLALCVLIKNLFSARNQEKASLKPRNVFQLSDIFACIICVLYVCVYFSNSFVVMEDSVSLFFGQTMIWILGFRALSSNLSKQVITSHKEIPSRHVKSKTSRNVFNILSHPATSILVVTSACSFCLRLSAPFRACREEQWSCNNTIFMTPLASLGVESQSHRNVRYFFSLACLTIFILSIRHCLKTFGNLNGYSPAVLCTKFAYPFAAVCCGFHWATQGMPQPILDSLPWWQQILLAQLVYISLLISAVILALKPLTVYKLPSPQDDPISVPYGEIHGPHVIPRLYRQLRQSWNSDREEKPPTVYGLGSVYTASILQSVLATGLLLALLLGDGLAPSLLLAVLILYFLLEIHGSTLHPDDNAENLQLVPWSLLITNCLLMSSFFFATGHQATVSSVKFDMAFTGFHGDFKYNSIPAVLITINTFASQIFFIVISPLLLFWPHLDGALSQLMRSPSKSVKQWRGDFVAYDDRASFQRNMVRLVFGSMFFSAMKVLASMCAAGLHRRHLMVWKIFAPRFVFEGAAMFVTFATLTVVYLFVIRVDRAVHKYSTRVLNKDK